jgi:uncharacterized membrane protein HdeD (DUF308 family)
MSDSGTIGTAELAAVGKALWWMVLLRGVFAILFGIVAFVFPGATLTVLAIVFAAYSLVDGVTEIVHAIRMRSRPRWGWLLLQGILSVLAGLVAAVFPLLAATVGAIFVIYAIAFWSIFTGVAGFPAAHAITDGGRRAWAYVAAVASVVFGVALAIIVTVTPAMAVQALVWTVAAYAIVFGVLLIVVAITARSAARRVLAGA